MPAILQSPTDTYSCILPLVEATKLLGFTCYAFNPRLKKYRASNLRVAYNIFVICLLVLLGFGIADAFPNMAYYSQNIITRVGDYFQMFGPLFLSIVSLISAHKLTTIILCIETLDRVDTELTNHGVQIPHKKNQTFVFSILAIGYCTLGLFFYLDSIVFHSGDTDSELVDFPPVYWLGYTVPKFLNYITSTTFVAWVLAIRQRIYFVNKLILETVHHDVDLSNRLPKLYGNVWTLASNINDIFSLQILIVMTTCFIDITASFFFGMRQLFLYMNHQTGPAFLMMMVYWTTWFSWNVVWICLVCESTRKEVKELSIRSKTR